MANRESIFNAIHLERVRQETLKLKGKFKWSCNDDVMKIVSTIDNGSMADAGRLAVLAEEFGEVARHVMESIIDSARYNPLELKKELVEISAVCVAWIESIDDDLQTL